MGLAILPKMFPTFRLPRVSHKVSSMLEIFSRSKMANRTVTKHEVEVWLHLSVTDWAYLLDSVNLTLQLQY